MSGQSSGLTLEALAERLGALERENEALRNEVAELRGSNESRAVEQVHELDGRVSRRSLIRNAGAAAVAAIATGTLLNTREAKADHFASGIEVDYVFAHSTSRSAVVGVSEGPNGIYGVYGRAERPGFASVYGQNTTIDGVGVRGQSLDGIGVKGKGAAGVHGESSTNNRGAVEGSNTAGEGYGVWGNASNIGVRGTGGTYGVYGGTNNTTSGGAGVGGYHQSLGPGVWGGSSRGPGLYGRSDGGSRGAVEGQHFGSGYGGLFQGGKAQLRLVPALDSGPPEAGSHFKGEIYMDTSGTLFVCTGTGIPGTWRRFTTVAT